MTPSGELPRPVDDGSADHLPGKSMPAIELPTFEFDGRRFYQRLTLVLREGAIEAALYPVFPPDQAAAQALECLRHPSAGTNIID
jgi:hypothetical protein